MKKYPKNYKHYIKNEVDLVTFTEEILNGKLHFLCSEKNNIQLNKSIILPIAIWVNIFQRRKTLAKLLLQ